MPFEWISVKLSLNACSGSEHASLIGWPSCTRNPSCLSDRAANNEPVHFYGNLSIAGVINTSQIYLNTMQWIPGM